MAELLRRRDDTILLYSADMEGHREVYCRVIADFLLGRGCRVVIAGRMTGSGGSGYAQLEPLRTHARVRLVDTASQPPDRRTLDIDALSRLMVEYGAHTIVFAEADAHLSLLIDQLRLGRRRLPGRRVGIFVRSTNYVHARPQRRTLKAVLSQGRSRAEAWRRDPQLFHEQLLPRFNLLDAALCLDEVFAASKGGPHAWLPDIFRTEREPPGQEDDPEFKWLGHLAAFTDSQGDRPLLVYYGTARLRKGYDSIVRLSDAEGASFIHCGRRDVPEAEGSDVRTARDRLRRSGRLFETEATIRRFDVSARFLAAADCIVLPYRDHLGSSGVMLQALEARRPVLVPDVGLMAERTVRHGLGLTYRHGDYEDLRRQYRRLRAQGPVAYQENIACFLRYFEGEQVEAAISSSLGWRAAGARNPMQSLRRSVDISGRKHVR